jgi:hypothetical protein
VADYSRRLENAFTDPPNFQGMVKYLNHGFRVFSELSQERRIDLVRKSIDAFVVGLSEEPRDLSTRYNIPESEARPLVFATSMMLATLTEAPDPVEQFIAAGIEKGAFTAETAAIIQPHAELICSERTNIQEAVKKETLASSVLPSLMTFSVAVDLRLKFEKDKIIAAVPVLVAHLDTDAEHQAVWVQLTQADTERIIDQLQTGLASLKAAERAAEKIGG